MIDTLPVQDIDAYRGIPGAFGEKSARSNPGHQSPVLVGIPNSRFCLGHQILYRGRLFGNSGRADRGSPVFIGGPELFGFIDKSQNIRPAPPQRINQFLDFRRGRHFEFRQIRDPKLPQPDFKRTPVRLNVQKLFVELQGLSFRPGNRVGITTLDVVDDAVCIQDNVHGSLPGFNRCFKPLDQLVLADKIGIFGLVAFHLGFHAIQSIFRPAEPHTDSQSHLIDLSLPGALIDPEQPTGGITDKRDLVQNSVGRIGQESKERSDADANAGHLHVLVATEADAISDVDPQSPLSELFGANPGLYFPHAAVKN
ncbi:MAG: hypothetical protein BWY42_00840 [Candidatus Omnitrophica bacterium ADurb.Bin277]|nr:MAG: hypothetical protein BWY42_00840 [Candidatus Omnitrophica bacterium ADurb.Bin277]